MLKHLQSLSVKSLRTTLSLTRSLTSPLLGEPPTSTNGARLDPQLQALALAAGPFSLRGFLERGVSYTRPLSRLGMKLLDGDGPDLPLVEDLTIDGPEGDLTLRRYSPDPAERLPGCVFYHGGGFVIGDLDTHDGFCRLLARRGNCHVLSLDYRLAPEHPFPAAVEDAVAGFRWVREHAEDLKIDADRLAVAGDSAGGTLATVVAQTQLRANRRTPAFQFLLYPKTDHGGEYPSRTGPGENALLTWEAVEWFAKQYLGNNTASPESDYRISPLRFDRLEVMPPTLLATAGFDPLRDEGVAYAEALSASGVDVTHRRYGSLVHGFVSLGGVVDRAREATRELTEEFREGLR